MTEKAKRATEMTPEEYRQARKEILKKKPPATKTATDMTDGEAAKQFPPDARNLSADEYRAARTKLTRRR